MRKGAIAIVLAAVVWSGLAHAGAQDTTLRRGAQLVLKYAEEHGGELGKEFVKHLTFSAVIDGLKELLFNKPEQSPLPDSELRRLRETIERMLADQEFRERQKQEKEVMEYMDRWDRCSSPSYATEEPDAVIEACSEIVRSEGEPIQDISTAYNNRGIAYAQKGDHDRAISDYTKAIEINARNGDAYSNRSNAYEQKGDHDRAIADSSKAI